MHHVRSADGRSTHLAAGRRIGVASARAVLPRVGAVHIFFYTLYAL